MALTLLILMGLVKWLAPRDERIVVRFTRPAGTPPPRLRPGISYQVEGIADPGNAVYRAVHEVDVWLIERNERLPFGGRGLGLWRVNYDPSSKRFWGSVTLPNADDVKNLYLSPIVTDKTGRVRRMGFNSWQARRFKSDPVLDAEELPITIE
jgi:hypothetical protein